MTRMLEVEEIMAILPSTVGRLGELTAGLPHALLHAPPEPGAWSANDVLAHLRACDDVLGGCMVRILTEDHPAWAARSPRTWQAKSGYHDWGFEGAIEAFAAGRADLLRALEGIAPEAWERTATVRVPPRQVLERSTRYYGDWLAAHERAHLRHLPRIIAAARGKQAT